MADYYEDVIFHNKIKSTCNNGPQITKQGLINAIYKWVGDTWAPEGFTLGSSYAEFNGVYAQGNQAANIFVALLTDSNYDPILVADQGFVVKKDLSVGGFLGTNQGEIWIGHGRNSSTDKPRIAMLHSNQGYDTLYLTKVNCSTPAHLDLGNLTTHGDVTVNGTIALNNQRVVQFNTDADWSYPYIGGIRGWNNYRSKGIEVKFTEMNFGGGTWYPVLQFMYLYDTNYTLMHEFDMNGDFRYAGYLISFDCLDDLATLRTIKSKTNDSGTLIHDPATLKFLQDDKGLYSLQACIGWEISMQLKFLAKHDDHEAHIANLLKRIEALENQLSQKQTTA